MPYLIAGSWGFFKSPDMSRLAVDHPIAIGSWFGWFGFKIRNDHKSEIKIFLRAHA